MYRLFGLLCFTFLTIPTTFSQSTPPDTSDYPYWIDMMADPSVNFYQTQRAFELYWDGRTIEKGSGYKPFKRWEYNMSQIIDGKGNIPAPGSIEQEVEKYLYHRSNPMGSGGMGIGGTIGNGSATCQTTGNWIEIGPDYLPGNRTGQPNGLGRINGLAFHPTDSNIIYAGAPAGGVWITKDGGKTWTTNTDSLATLGVSSIAIDPIYPDTIYLGTGDRDASDSYGRGVFKSTDGGQTWVKMNATMGNVTVGRLLIDPNNTNVLLAATSGGIYRSGDGASTWTQQLTGNFKDLVFDAVNSNIVYTCRTSARLYRSTDNGKNWTQVTSGLPSSKNRMAVAVTPDDSNFVYALITNQRTYHGLYLSTDRGASFTLMSDTPNVMDYSHLGTGTGGQAWYDLDLAVHPDDKSIVSVAGVNIFQSTDSGRTWKINAHWVGSGGAPDVHADNHVLEYQPQTKTLFTGNDGGVYFTKDLGKSWIDISQGLGIAQIYRLGQSATHANTMINGYQDNGTGLYENSKWYTTIGGDGMECMIDPSDVNYAYGALYYGDIRRMKNGYSQGTIAKNGKNGITESGGWVTPYTLREGTPSTMFVGYKNVWRSTDIKATSVNSVTWTKISDNVAGSNSSNIVFLENSPANSDILYVSRSGNKFFKSTNVNASTPTWTDLTSSLPNNSSVLWIESHPKYQDRVWICQSNKVYQSNNGGSSWSNISTGLPNIPILSLVFDTSSKYQGMYAGTYMGVFYKDTTMSSWQWYNDNMPINTRVRDIEIYYSPAGRSKSHVVCATYGRGNWRSPLYDEDQEEPEAGFTISANKACMGTVVQFSDTSLNLPTNWFWEFTPNTVTYVNGTDSCSQFPQVIFNATGKYALKMYAENCMGYDSVEVSDLIEVFPSIKSAKCTPKTNNTTSSAGLGLYGLALDKYSFTSSGTKDEGEYLDMGCTEIMELKTDTGYVTDVLTGKLYKEYVKIYIDFNNNGDLEASELVYDTYELTSHRDTIKIPVNAVTDKLIRMRVMSDYNKIQHSCDTLGYGQTEDYGIILEASVPTPHFVIDTNKVCVNGSIILTDSSTGPVYKKRWYIGNGNDLKRVDSDGPVTFNLTDTGWYYAELVLNDSLVSKRIDSIVYVNPYPTSVLSIFDGNDSLCEGETIRFKNTTDQKTGVFAWYKNNVKLSGLNDSIITVGNVALKDSGSFSASVELNGCETKSSPIKLYVYPVPVAGFNITDRDTCLSTNTFDFSNSSTIKSGNMSYTWDFGDGNTSNSTSPSHVYSDTGSYQIQLVVLSPYKCADTAYAAANVWPGPTAGFTVNSSPQCLRGNNFVFTNNSTIDAGSLTFEWDHGNGTAGSGTNSSVRYTTENSYNVALVVISDKNCTDTSRVSVTVHPDPVASFNVNVVDSCLTSNSFDFTNQSTISSGSITNNFWDLGDDNTSKTVDNAGYVFGNIGTYVVQLIVESNNQCRDTVKHSIRVHPSPFAQFDLNDTSQCFNGNAFAISDQSSNGGGSIVSYAWDFGDGNTSASNNPTDHSYVSTGTYTINLSVITDQKCLSNSSRKVIVLPSPSASFTGGTGCVGESIDFANNSTMASPGTIDFTLWSFGDGNTSTINNPSNTYLTAGTYEVKLVVISDQGCRDSMIDKLAATIYEKPSADFTYTKIGSFDAQTEMEFNSNSTNATSWDWWINNLPSGNGQTYTHTFTDTGTYSVTLWVISSDGCSDSLVQTLFVVPDALLQVPTSFSPNNDNLNDQFIPRGVRFVKEYEMRIYNRWGHLLFESEDPSIGWDGTYGGDPVPPGQYLVQVETVDFNNQKTKYNGMISVVR